MAWPYTSTPLAIESRSVSEECDAHRVLDLPRIGDIPGDQLVEQDQSHGWGTSATRAVWPAIRVRGSRRQRGQAIHPRSPLPSTLVSAMHNQGIYK